MASVFRAHGRPSPTRMSNTLLPMELDTAMSPIPGHRRTALEPEDDSVADGGRARGTKTADGDAAKSDDEPKKKHR